VIIDDPNKTGQVHEHFPADEASGGPPVAESQPDPSTEYGPR